VAEVQTLLDDHINGGKRPRLGLLQRFFSASRLLMANSCGRGIGFSGITAGVINQNVKAVLREPLRSSRTNPARCTCNNGDLILLVRHCFSMRLREGHCAQIVARTFSEWRNSRI
jgi:hypothetical protein